MRQEYQTNPMFPVRCFSFKSSKKLLKDTYAKVQTLAYRNYNAEFGVGTSDELQHNPDFYDLHEWFQECIDTLHAFVIFLESYYKIVLFKRPRE